MPSLEASRAVNLNNRVRAANTIMPAQTPSAPTPLPANLSQSTVMLSSLPSIATNVDGITRQFYGGRSLPTRRLILPS